MDGLEYCNILEYLFDRENCWILRNLSENLTIGGWSISKGGKVSEKLQATPPKSRDLRVLSWSLNLV